MYIPTINLDSKAVSSNSAAKYLDSLNKLTVDYILAMTNNGENTGIISSTDPKVIPTSETHLWVDLVSGSNTELVIYPGKCCTSVGHIMDQSDTINLSLSDVTEDGINIVIMMNELHENNDKVLNSDNTYSSSGTHYESSINCLSISSYNNLQPYEINDSVVLAVVIYKEDGSIVYYDTDTANAYLATINASNIDFNIRPWFSATDIQHRSQYGSGTVTTSNPHGLATTDLTDKDGTSIYDMFGISRGILHRGYYEGELCSVTVKASTFSVDRGVVTKPYEFGGVGSVYLKLGFYPTRLAGVYLLDSSDSDYNSSPEIPAANPKGTDLIILNTNKLPDSSKYIQIFYYNIPSLAISSYNNSTIVFNSITDTDCVVTKGKRISSLANQIIQVGYGSIPMNASVNLDSSGSLFLNKTILTTLAYKTSTPTVNDVATLSSTATTRHESVLGLAFQMYKSLLSEGASYSIEVKFNLDNKPMIYKIDLVATTTNNIYNITLTSYKSYDGSDYSKVGSTVLTYKDTYVAVDEENQFLWFTDIIPSGTSITITQPSALLKISLIEKINDNDFSYLEVAKFFWNKLSIVNLLDTRNTLSSLNYDKQSVVYNTISSLEIASKENIIIGEQFDSLEYNSKNSSTSSLLNTKVPMLSDIETSSGYRSFIIPTESLKAKSKALFNIYLIYSRDYKIGLANDNNSLVCLTLFPDISDYDKYKNASIISNKMINKEYLYGINNYAYSTSSNTVDFGVPNYQKMLNISKVTMKASLDLSDYGINNNNALTSYIRGVKLSVFDTNVIGIILTYEDI